MMFSDDHAWQAVSAYGGNLNKTPHIDRIAHEGMRFDQCLVTNSICAPSRAVVLTGYGAIATAVAAVKIGAIDYLSKPADADDVASTRRFCAHMMPDLGGKISAVRGNEDVFERHDLHSVWATLLQPEVKLAGGGRLFIEPTRALWAIDVDG
ncbi:MAG: sulfatase-like hydrolase/transferase, partial [Chloroflexaceae bacterium]|nr:sulfatase-like hydrolase/transferase [Chloroflexaceae bacterium]